MCRPYTCNAPIVLYAYAHSAVLLFQNNERWSLKMDQQVMEWAVTHPEDWQPGGRSEVYLTGGGRNGQLCEIGVSSMAFKKADSFSLAQKVC